MLIDTRTFKKPDILLKDYEGVLEKLVCEYLKDKGFDKYKVYKISFGSTVTTLSLNKK